MCLHSAIRAKEAADEQKRAAVKAEAQMLATALTTIGKFTVKKTAGTGDDKTKLFGRCGLMRDPTCKTVQQLHCDGLVAIATPSCISTAACRTGVKRRQKQVNRATIL